MKKQNKTGGGVGTNQYKIKGVSVASIGEKGSIKGGRGNGKNYKQKPRDENIGEYTIKIFHGKSMEVEKNRKLIQRRATFEDGGVVLWEAEDLTIDERIALEDMHLDRYVKVLKPDELSRLLRWAKNGLEHLERQKANGKCEDIIENGKLVYRKWNGKDEQELEFCKWKHGKVEKIFNERLR
jgi:hypothetical protein